ncbi:two component transcriptional regulator [Citreicella sp. 357]|nr:two component transcriptional regulator [Citreicella sp. 357]
MKDLVDAPHPGAIRSVVIVDDHPLYSDGLAATLGLALPEARMDKARNLRAMLDLVDAAGAPDLVMFGLNLPDVTGILRFRAVRLALPDAPVLVISSLTSVGVVQALMEEGAAGVLPRHGSVPVLRHALAEIAAGRKYLRTPYDGAALAEIATHPALAELTPQQKKILKLICAGMPHKQIAYELSLAEAMVTTHITALMRRLGVRTRAAALNENARPATIETPAQTCLSH